MTVSGLTGSDGALFDDEAKQYDAVLVVSFGGPEGPDDVLPFLRNVVKGRDVSADRLQEVAAHYHRFGGVSPINRQNRALMDALRVELDAHGHALPIYYGNRNWHPFLEEAIGQMADDGVKHAVAFVTSGFSCYSGCRQYRENVVEAMAKVSGAPMIDKLRVFFNHPGFVKAAGANVRAAMNRISADRRNKTRIVFTAHSIPITMADSSQYVRQLKESCKLVAEAAGAELFDLVYQSGSGSPTRPWLEPDILDHLRDLESIGVTEVVVMPIGFTSDHMEVQYDLDYEAGNLARELNITLERASTVGTSPAFVSMIRELIEERTQSHPDRRVVGAMPPSHDVCPKGCCEMPRRSGKNVPT